MTSNYKGKCRIYIMKYKTIMFAGPSAVGKTYTANQLVKKYPDSFEQAKLFTTRKARSAEMATDREFISHDKFKHMKDSGEFIVSEKFGENWYGFTTESIEPTNKHLLVNIWPWLAEKFSKLDHVILVGMMPQENWESMLVSRMKNRGDSKKDIETRKKLINKDIEDLKYQSKYVESSGKMFSINDN